MGTYAIHVLDQFDGATPPAEGEAVMAYGLDLRAGEQNATYERNEVMSLLGEGPHLTYREKRSADL